MNECKYCGKEITKENIDWEGFCCEGCSRNHHIERTQKQRKIGKGFNAGNSRIW